MLLGMFAILVAILLISMRLLLTLVGVVISILFLSLSLKKLRTGLLLSFYSCSYSVYFLAYLGSINLASSRGLMGLAMMEILLFYFSSG